jgi:hypothetical protein
MLLKILAILIKNIFIKIKNQNIFKHSLFLLIYYLTINLRFINRIYLQIFLLRLLDRSRIFL